MNCSLCLALTVLCFGVFAASVMIDSPDRENNLLGPVVYATTTTTNDSFRSNDSNLGGISANLSNSADGTVDFRSSDGPHPGTLQIPYTGLSRYHVSPEDAKLFGLKENSFAMVVTEVEPMSSAAVAGIRGGNLTTNVAGDTIKIGGDIILEIDGNDTFVRTNDAFLNYLRDKKSVGENMTLTLLRDGQVKNVDLTIGALPRFYWYENNDEGIRIKYPSDWEVSESESKGDVVKFFSPNTIRYQNGTLPVAGVLILVAPTGDNGLDDYATLARTDSGDRRNLDLVLTSISDFPGYKSVYYDYSDSNRTLKVLSAFTIKDGQIYRINFGTEISRFDDYLPIANEMIRSFQFTK